MIFGETYEAFSHRMNTEKKRVFCLLPRWLDDGRIAWLENVERSYYLGERYVCTGVRVKVWKKRYKALR